MKVISYSLISIIIFNFVLIISFITGKHFIFKNEKRYLLASYYSVYLAFLFIIYFISIIIFLFTSFFCNLFLFGLILSIFIFTPFIIGHFASYKRINFYTNIQILTLILNLIAGIVVYLNIV